MGILSAFLLAGTLNATACLELATFGEAVAIDRDHGISMESEEVGVDSALLKTRQFSPIVSALSRAIIKKIYNEEAMRSPQQVYKDIVASCQ